MLGPRSANLKSHVTYPRPAAFRFFGIGGELGTIIQSSSPNRRTYTISFWINFDLYDAAHSNNTLLTWRLDANNELDMFNFSDLNLTAMVNDSAGADTMNRNFGGAYTVGTWVHVVWSIDTTQAAGASRILSYRDGSLVGSIITTPALNLDTRFMVNGDNFTIGGQAAFPASGLIGRIAFLQIVEGQQLLPTAFTVTEGGIVKHRRFEGNFGIHGMYFEGSKGLVDRVRGVVLTPVAPIDSGRILDGSSLPPWVNF